ncbi:Vacuolar protein sorting-associated protein 72 [Coemansia erecta]|uniref:Vacuolar protein sorting-associated protein 72 n=1 Tax=Coemansia erecta TaxID=147472 RepID=A0A9W7Y5J8_9FUNG|nr:Vacuolar protein sorting-associated protein 72 [Coemansia erecta]
MSTSARRSRRQNAGNKMLAMVEEERAKIASGEVQASDEDEDFARLADQDDVVDSDFAETDSEEEQRTEEANQAAELMLERAERRQQRKAARKRMVVPHFSSSKPGAVKATVTTATVKKQKQQKSSTSVERASDSASGKRGRASEVAVRVSSRSSAVRKAQESEALEIERGVLAEIKRSKRQEVPGRNNRASADVTKHGTLTQEQLLEEAKLTEIENVKRLRMFQEQEAEDRQWQKRLAQRRAPLIIHPVAHVRSFVRVVDEREDKAEGGLAEEAGQVGERRVGTEYALDKLDSRYPLDPWKERFPVLPLKMCPVTGLPARYFHPRAKVPYANARAYRVLEEMVRGEHAYFYDIGAWSSAAIADN